MSRLRCGSCLPVPAGRLSHTLSVSRRQGLRFGYDGAAASSDEAVNPRGGMIRISTSGPEVVRLVWGIVFE